MPKEPQCDHTVTHSPAKATECSVAVRGTVHRLRNAGNGNVTWSQFLMRLELKSTCSSWTGNRQLPPSERQIVKKNTVQSRRGRKREAGTFLVPRMTRHQGVVLGSVLGFPASARNSENALSQEPGCHLILNIEFSSSQSNSSCVCRGHFKTVPFYVGKRFSVCSLKDCPFWILSALNRIPRTSSLHHFCRD